jgi:hypothetical protein
MMYQTKQVFETSQVKRNIILPSSLRVISCKVLEISGQYRFLCSRLDKQADTGADQIRPGLGVYQKIENARTRAGL